MPFPSPGDLPNPGIELRSLVFQADSLQSYKINLALFTLSNFLKKFRTSKQFGVEKESQR